jgi:hypothetical protein
MQILEKPVELKLIEIEGVKYTSHVSLIDAFSEFGVQKYILTNAIKNQEVRARKMGKVYMVDFAHFAEWMKKPNSLAKRKRSERAVLSDLDSN